MASFFNKILRIALVVMLAYLIVIFCYAWVKPSVFKASYKSELNTPLKSVKSFLFDYKSLPIGIDKVQAVEELDSAYTKTQKIYQVRLKSGHHFCFYTHHQSDTSHMMHIFQSTFGYQSKWYFTYFASDEDMCFLEIKEEANVSSYWLRLWLLIVGDDIFLREEFRGLIKRMKDHGF